MDHEARRGYVKGKISRDDETIVIATTIRNRSTQV